jgi:poly-gamma-glutamate capsule biosynthesis protein CapA/YwtB (metallophosphatase superfamily)
MAAASRRVSTQSSSAASRGERRAVSRRAVLAGAVPVVVAATAAAGSLAVQYSRSVEAPARGPAPAMASSPTAAGTASAESTPGTALATPAAQRVAEPTEAQAVARQLPNRGIPEGMALVASPRLPLAGIAPEDPWRLLTGRIGDWAEVGSAVPIAVRPLALTGATFSGLQSDQSFATYDELVAALAGDAGAVALVPLEVVDFRAQTLMVGLDDPLRERIAGQATATIGIIGDIVPGRNVHLHMEQYGDFTRPFLRVAPLLSSFDVTVANLEGNLSNTLPQPVDPHSFSFVSSPAMLDGFALAGIDAVTLANNHTVWNSENWGLQGLLDTIDALELFGLPYFGAGRDLASARAPWIVGRGGLRIGFLGIDGVTANYEAEPSVANGVLDFDAGATSDRAGTNPYLAWQVADDIAAATRVADVVIPYFHFGEEYVAIPPQWAAQAARAAIDAGATMVVSNHPHVVQGMEVYQGRPIVYSPGNFIMDQMWAAEVRSGCVLEVDLRGTQIVGLRFHGIEIEDFHQPRPMSAEEQAALMDRFWAAADRLAARDGATA